MSAARPDAIVVGSGPNGLAAAVVLARAGLAVEVLEAEETIGGGARTLELGLADGIQHDLCSAVHPLALASPFLRSIGLAQRIELRVPEASYAQPLDDGAAAIAWRDLERTADGLGADGRAWRRLFGPAVRGWEAIAALVLGDARSLPDPRSLLRSAGALGAFAAGAAAQGTAAWNWPLRTERARALLSGVAAHSIAPLPSIPGGGAAMLLATLGHATGWPIPVGGSQAIIDALLADLRAHGGIVRTGVPVRTWRDLPPAAVTMLDTTPQAAAAILSPRLPRGLERALARSPRSRGAAAKVDLVVDAPIPWRDEDVGRAGTVHLGGSRLQMAQAEADVARGRRPERPVVLLSDPSVVDPRRSRGGLRPLWSYAHVPFGDPTDPTEAVLAQIERFAPGFRDTIIASRAVPAAQMASHNRSLVGGDISMGAVDLPRLLGLRGPRIDPYRLLEADARGGAAYLCSAAVPPGPGVHGMSGFHAARRALRDDFGIRDVPDLRP